MSNPLFTMRLSKDETALLDEARDRLGVSSYAAVVRELIHRYSHKVPKATMSKNDPTKKGRRRKEA